MLYTVDNNKILIEDTENFVPKDIVECGQVFRYLKDDLSYKIFSKNLFCSLIYVKDRVIIETTDVDYFINYFDLNRDYGAIKTALLGYPEVKKSISVAKGLRILNQDPIETIISFIISANNNIPRIQGIIDRLCKGAGEDMGGYFAFPTIDELLHKPTSFYKDIGAGYRATYLSKTVDALAHGFQTDINGMDTPTARKHLMTLTGVGRKVADCILLFGYHRTDVFPTDTWIEKVYDNLYGESSLSAVKKSDIFTNRFGELSGYAQQYLFYSAREGLI